MEKTLIKIFISSPMDVGPERQAAEEVIDNLNRDLGKHVSIKSYRYEYEPMLISEGYQDQIEDPGETDIFVCILWSRLGTPLPDKFRKSNNEKYLSGTEFEFDRAITAFEKFGKPLCMMYLKKEKAQLDNENQRLQKERVDTFIDSVTKNDDGTIKGALNEFLNISDFKEILQSKLKKLIIRKYILKEGSDVSTDWFDEPYKGLNSFNLEDAPIFFGRRKTTEEILNILSRQKSNNKAFIQIIGASGSGKSSLIKAGIVPKLNAGEMIVFTPSEADDDLCKSLKAKLNGEKFIILVLDQMEELFTETRFSQGEVVSLIKEIQLLAKDKRYTIISALRSDFYHKFAEIPEFVELKSGGQYDLLKPNISEIEEIIRFPALKAGLMFGVNPETGEKLDDILINRVAADSYVLPLLEFTLAELYKRVTIRSDGLKELSFHSYEEIGGVEGAIQAHSEETLNKLPGSVQGEFQQIFRNMASFRMDGYQSFSAKTVRWDDIVINKKREEFINAFISARLVVSGNDSNGYTTIRVAHEALFYCWPRLNKVLEDSKDYLRIRENVERAESIWAVEQKKDFLIPKGKQLNEAVHILKNYENDLSETTRKYIRLSLRESEKNSKIKKSLAVCAAAIVTCFSLISFYLYRKADTERVNTQKAESLAVSSIAKEQIDNGDRVAAGLLALDVLPKDVSNPDRPLVRKAEMLLLNSINYPSFQSVTVLYHNGLLKSGQFSPDGKLILTSGNENAARIWDAETGKLIRTLDKHKAWIQNACFSPDGKKILTVSWDGYAIVWDTYTGKIISRFSEHEGMVIYGAFSPDSQKAVTLSEDNTARIWEAESGKQLIKLSGIDRNGLAAFTPNGEMVVTSSDSAPTKLWDAKNGELLQEFSQSMGRAFAISNTGDIIAIGLDKGVVGIWNVFNGNIETTFGTDKVEVKSIAFSKDDKKFAAGLKNGTVVIWDNDTRNTTAVFEKFAAEVSSVAFSPNGKLLAACSFDKTARVFDTENNTELAVLNKHTNILTDVEFNEKGDKLITISNDRTARVWSISGNQKYQFLSEDDKTTAAVITPDSSKAILGLSDGSIDVWNIKTLVYEDKIKAHEKTITSISVNSNGSKILTSSEDMTAKLWDFKTRSLIKTFGKHTGSIYCSKFSKDGSMIATASEDQSAIVWDANSGDVIADFEGHSKGVITVEFSPDGKELLTVSEDGAARVWDIKNKKLKFIIRHLIDIEKYNYSPDYIIQMVTNLYSDKIISAAYSPDGKNIVTASEDKTAKVWSAENGKELLTLEGHTHSLDYAVFSPDNKKIITTSVDNTARIYDAASGNLITILEKHTSRIIRAAFSPDSRMVATVSGDLIGSGLSDNSIKLWDIESGEEIAELLVHKSFVRYVSFSSDGKSILTFSDKAVVWMPNLMQGQDLINYAKLIMKERQLTSEERKRFSIKNAQDVQDVGQDSTKGKNDTTSDNQINVKLFDSYLTAADKALMLGDKTNAELNVVKCGKAADNNEEEGKYFLEKSLIDLANNNIEQAVLSAQKAVGIFEELNKEGMYNYYLAGAYNNYALIEEYNKNPSESIEICKKAIQLGNINNLTALVNMHLANAYLLSGDFEASLEIYKNIEDKVINSQVITQFDTIKVRNNKTIKIIALDLLEDMKKRGVTYPDMNKVESILKE